MTCCCEAEPVCVPCVARESSHTCLVTEVLSAIMAHSAQAVRMRVLCFVPECLTPLSAGLQPDSRLHDACLQPDRGPDHHSHHSTGGLQRHPGRGRKLRYKHGSPLGPSVLMSSLSTLRRAAHGGQSGSCCRDDCSTYGMLPDAWHILADFTHPVQLGCVCVCNCDA